MTALIALAAMQGGGPAPEVKVKLPTSVMAGQTFKANLTVRFADGLHGYQNPPTLDYEIPVTVKLASGPAKVVKVVYPKGVSMVMTGDTKPTLVYTGQVSVEVVLKSGATSGPLSFEVDYQECNEGSCFPPSTVKVKSQLTVRHKG